MKVDKRSYLKKAKDLLATQDDSLLRYACLELRFCIEAIIYAKLQTYASRLPQKVLSKWQPPQAMRALLEIEPNASKSFTLTVAFQSAPGVPASGPQRHVGSHKSIDPTWLNKEYNKLGSLLHVPLPGPKSKEHNTTTVREYLERIAEELEPIVASTLDTSLANTLEFTCSECRQPVICNYEGVLANHRATCLNPGCGAEYTAARNEETGKISFSLVATEFQCILCKGLTWIEDRKLKVGLQFKCIQCGRSHEITTRGWQYSPVGP